MHLLVKVIVMKMDIGKIVIQLTAILALIFILPLGLERFLGNHSYLSMLRYILAAMLAIPTIVYAIRKYRKTAKRLYVFPCFMVALGFWVASMFFMQQRLPGSLYQKNLPVTIKEDNDLNRDVLIGNEKYFYLTHNKYGSVNPLFFDEISKLVLDSTSFN